MAACAAKNLPGNKLPHLPWVAENNNRHSNSSVKQSIFLVLIGLMLIPLFQYLLPFMDERPLEGVDPAAKLPEWTDSTWMSSEYQSAMEPALEQNIGFHNAFVRLHNQLNYSLFNIGAGDVVVGRNEYLFLEPYVRAVTGEDYLGREIIALHCDKISILQEELKKKGIDLFIVLATGKGSFYAEYLPPGRMQKIVADSTNYAVYKDLLSGRGVNVLDLREKFGKAKASEKCPVYSNTGVHWTDYGYYIAAKEIVSYIEKLRNIDLPDFSMTSAEMMSLSGPKCKDYDAANLLNLAFRIPQPEVAIPKIRFDAAGKKTKPDFLCISDSYFPGIIHTGIPDAVFSTYHNWLYNDRIFPESFLHEKHVRDLDIKAEIEKQDVICILGTDATLTQFPFDFVDKAFEIYGPQNKKYQSVKMKEHRLSIFRTLWNIQHDVKWKAALDYNAKQNGIPEMQEYISNAQWIYNERQHQLKNE